MAERMAPLFFTIKMVTSNRGTYNEYYRGEEIFYYPDGKLEYRCTKPNEAGYDSSINYFSNGKIKKVLVFKANTWIIDSAMKKSNLLFGKIQNLKKAKSIRSAKKMLAEIIDIHSSNTDAYMAFGFFMMEKISLLMLLRFLIKH